LPANSVGQVLTERRAVTPDLGGMATTMERAEAIAAALA
jgi:isocitrate/isopropylmalate dehydrogenase